MSVVSKMWDCSEREKIKQAGECTRHQERSRSERSHPVWGSLATFSLFPLQNGLHVTACGRSECERAREWAWNWAEVSNSLEASTCPPLTLFYICPAAFCPTPTTLRALGSSEWATFSATRWLVWSGQVFSCCAAQSPAGNRTEPDVWRSSGLGFALHFWL